MLVFGVIPVRGAGGGMKSGTTAAGMRRLRRGILKFALLKLLDELPRHGYDLIRAVREKGWGAGAGSVYPVLAALEAAGLSTGAMKATGASTRSPSEDASCSANTHPTWSAGSTKSKRKKTLRTARRARSCATRRAG